MTRKRSFFSELNRRDFIRKSGGCSALSSLAVLSTLLNLRMTASAAAASSGGGYKALVCLFLYGGNDGHNLIAPYDSAEHAEYVNLRLGLHYDSVNGVALPRADDLAPTDSEWGMALKPISPTASSPNAGRDFGIHGFFNSGKNNQITSADDHIRDLYNAGSLSFVCNVGSLVHPDTNESNWRDRRPVGLFSHSDEQRNWMTTITDSDFVNIGVLGRIADMLTDSVNLNSKVAMNIAMDDINAMMVGSTTLPYIITDAGAQEFLFGDYPSTNPGVQPQTLVTSLTDSLLTDTYSNLLELGHSNARRGAIDVARDYTAATASATLMTDNANGFGPWPQTILGTDMKQIAKTIAARQALNQERQIFFVGRSGYDTHSAQINDHDFLMPELGETVHRFWKEIEAQGLQDCVTLFTASDFGRTYVPNSKKGTDHAWASNHFVVGGSQINGGDVLGTAPNVTIPGSFQTTDSRGRMIPTYSVDEYLSEVIRWFGDFSDSDLDLILPNYSRFAGRPEIGHMA